MKNITPYLLAAGVALATMGGGIATSSASTIGASTFTPPLLQSAGEAAPKQVRHRRYRRHRHGPRFRRRHGRYRHYHGGYWYVSPWWLFPPSYYHPPRRVYRGRCERWHRRCRANWGLGHNYRGCMRHHGCR